MNEENFNRQLHRIRSTENKWTRSNNELFDPVARDALDSIAAYTRALRPRLEKVLARLQCAFVP